MNGYALGRDVEALRCRLDRLEASRGAEATAATAARAHGIASVHAARAGVRADREPTPWKPDVPFHLPPFLRPLLHGARGGPQFDVMPESKTWTCHPEPLVLSVTWFAGGTDAFYQYQDQLFSVIRFTDPNTGHVSATATYQARRVALGKAKSHLEPLHVDAHGIVYQETIASSRFAITLRGPGGANIGGYTSPAYSILTCTEAHDIAFAWEINAGIFDLVTGATWEVIGAQDVDRC